MSPLVFFKGCLPSSLSQRPGQTPPAAAAKSPVLDAFAPHFSPAVAAPHKSGRSARGAPRWGRRYASPPRGLRAAPPAPAPPAAPRARPAGRRVPEVAPPRRRNGVARWRPARRDARANFSRRAAPPPLRLPVHPRAGRAPDFSRAARGSGPAAAAGGARRPCRTTAPRCQDSSHRLVMTANSGKEERRAGDERRRSSKGC